MSATASSPVRLQSLVQVFERGRELNPDGPAIREAGREVSYRELDVLIGGLAAELEGLGVRCGQRVAIWLPKSIEAIAAMQAVLRIGAAYVPVDPLSPVERVRRLLDDCQPAASVALAGDVERAFGSESPQPALLTLSHLDGEWASRGGGGPSNSGDRSTAKDDELAYILYTSGSTGTPKGVCVSHRNALAFVEWAHAELAPGSEDRFAGHAALHFDLSVLDVYVAFLAGACLCPVPEAISYVAEKLVDFVHGERITVWYSVPSALMLMERAGLLEHPPQTLRTVLFAGESFPIEPLRHLRHALPATRLLNLYGPTETNVCSFHEVGEIDDDDSRPVPIGRACSGDEIWIEDEQGRRLPVGGSGELVVAGPSVMLGYWGGLPQRGPYRTGDLAERISADEYRYLGRRDAMVKVRGHRVEPGEIEATIAGHPDVSEVAVAVLGEGLESRLVAAVVARPGATPDLLEVKRWCAARLPRHMIVHGLRPLDHLPRNHNGKLDRRGLEALLGAEGARQ